MMQALISDMDGTLIDSEPLWREAQVEIYNFYGMPITTDMLGVTMGMRVDEIVEYWMKKFEKEIDIQEVSNRVNEKALALILKKGEARPGTHHTLSLAKKMGLKIAVASSSSENVMDKILEKLKVKNYFDLIHSAQSEKHGKPHPAVYLGAAEGLQTEPFECVVLEDSVNGLIAAKAAQMKCIVIPDKSEKNKKEFCDADKILNSLEEFNEQIISNL